MPRSASDAKGCGRRPVWSNIAGTPRDGHRHDVCRTSWKEFKLWIVGALCTFGRGAAVRYPPRRPETRYIRVLWHRPRCSVFAVTNTWCSRLAAWLVTLEGAAVDSQPP